MLAMRFHSKPLAAVDLILRPPSARPPLPAAAAAGGAISKRRPFGKLAATSKKPTLTPSMAEFPYSPPAHHDLMADLVSTVESWLDPQLLPSAVPADVLSFASPTGSSCGALDIRSGVPGSTVDFILASWLHCKVPTGALNITTLFAFLNTFTDAPHLLIEFTQGSPTSLLLFIDLLPRKDLVLEQDYLHEFYHKTHLDNPRQEIEAIPQVLPYRSSNLHFRSVLSPTAIAVNINCGAGGESAMEEIVRGAMTTVSKDIVGIWLDTCASSSKPLGEAQKLDLLKRDGVVKKKAVEVDLAANFPRLFGPDVADRIVGEVQKAFKI